MRNVSVVSVITFTKYHTGFALLTSLLGLADPASAYLDDFDRTQLEVKVNVAVEGTQPPGTELGIVFFNEDEWAYSFWNVCGGIGLRDCIGGDCRWFDHPPGGGTQVRLGFDAVAIDQDVYLKVVKTGDQLEFFAKGDATEDWISGGVDTKLGPYYQYGSYKVGILATSWGAQWFGWQCSTFEIDCFDIPEISSPNVSSVAIKPEYQQAPMGSQCAVAVSL